MHQLSLTCPSLCFCALPRRPRTGFQILAGRQRGWRGPALPTGRSHGSSPPAASRGGRWRGWEGRRTGGLSLLLSLPPSPPGTPLSGLWCSQRPEVPSAGSGRHLTHQSAEVLFSSFQLRALFILKSFYLWYLLAPRSWLFMCWIIRQAAASVVWLQRGNEGSRFSDPPTH